MRSLKDEKGQSRKRKLVLAAIALLLLLGFSIGMTLRGQAAYEPENSVSQMNIDRSHEYMTGTGYETDDAQKQEDKKVEKKKKASDAKKKTDANRSQVSNNSRRNATNTNGAADNGDTNNTETGDGNYEEENGKKSDKPTIETDLKDGEKVSGKTRSFWVKAQDKNSKSIGAGSVTVLVNNSRITSRGSRDKKITYRASLNDGSNTISIKATDDYGKSTTKVISVLCDASGTSKVIGTVYVTVEAKTVGLGTLIGRQSVDLHKGDSAADAFDACMEANSAYGYGSKGSVDSGFFLDSIKKPGITSGAKIPDKLQEYIDDAGLTMTSHSSDRIASDDFVKGSGWMYAINGEYMDTSMSAASLTDGDSVLVQFSLYFGYDLDGTWKW